MKTAAQIAETDVVMRCLLDCYFRDAKTKPADDPKLLEIEAEINSRKTKHNEWLEKGGG